MKRNTTSGRVSFEWERDIQSGPIEFWVNYTIYPFVLATFNAPAEGGECELGAIELVSELLDPRDTERAIEQIDEALEADAKLRAAVEDRCRENAEDRWQSDQEEAADAKLQRRRDDG